MKTTQSNLIYSWAVIILTIIYIFVFFNKGGLVLYGAFVSLPLYSYFRGSIDNGLNIFEYIPESWKKYIAGYYLLAAFIVIGNIINNPNIELFELEGRMGYLKLMLLIGAPFLIIWLKREIYLYKESRNENI